MLTFIENILKGVKQWTEGLLEERDYVIASHIVELHTDKADASVYAKDGDGNAHITKPLSIGDGAASDNGAVASGHADGGASIQATGEGAVASGRAEEGGSIQASGGGAVARGYAGGEGSSIQAISDGAVASGCANGEVGNVLASGYGSMAVGIGVQATADDQAVVGRCNVADEDDTFQFIVGNGSDDEHRSNGFAVTKSGELALFKADGTPIYLDATKLEALIAMLPTT